MGCYVIGLLQLNLFVRRYEIGSRNLEAWIYKQRWTCQQR